MPAQASSGSGKRSTPRGAAAASARPRAARARGAASGRLAGAGRPTTGGPAGAGASAGAGAGAAQEPRARSRAEGAHAHLEGTHDKLGRALSELLENPLVTGTIGRALGAREKAAAAQELAMGALNLPSAADIERLTRRVRSVSQRLEGVEDGVQDLGRSLMHGSGASDRLVAIEGRLASIDTRLAAIESALVAPAAAPVRARGEQSRTRRARG